MKSTFWDSLSSKSFHLILKIKTLPLLIVDEGSFVLKMSLYFAWIWNKKNYKIQKLIGKEKKPFIIVLDNIQGLEANLTKYVKGL